MKIISASKGIDQNISIEIDWEKFVYVGLMVIDKQKRNMELNEIEPILFETSLRTLWVLSNSIYLIKLIKFYEI